MSLIPHPSAPYLCINLSILTIYVCFNHILLTYSAFFKGHVYASENQIIPLCSDRTTYVSFKCLFLGDILSKGFYLLNDISANLERKISILQIPSLPSFKKTWLYRVRETVSDFSIKLSPTVITEHKNELPGMKWLQSKLMQSSL